MAYYAKIDNTGKVTQITGVADSIAITEGKGEAYLNKIHRTNDTWKQFWKTGTDPNPRKNGAAIGFIYDEARDAFIEQCDFPSWVLNETTCRYEPPVAQPEAEEQEDGTFRPYYWDEETTSWILAPMGN